MLQAVHVNMRMVRLFAVAVFGGLVQYAQSDRIDSKVSVNGEVFHGIPGTAAGVLKVYNIPFINIALSIYFKVKFIII